MRLSGKIDGIDDARIEDRAVGKTVKFIMANVSDRRSSKMVLRADDVGFHNDIYLKLQEELGDGFKIDVVGGGMLYLNYSDKTIKLSGASTAFGKPDYKIAQQLLQTDYSSFKVIVAP